MVPGTIELIIYTWLWWRWKSRIRWLLVWQFTQHKYSKHRYLSCEGLRWVIFIYLFINIIIVIVTTHKQLINKKIFSSYAATIHSTWLLVIVACPSTKGCVTQPTNNNYLTPWRCDRSHTARVARHGLCQRPGIPTDGDTTYTIYCISIRAAVKRHIDNGGSYSTSKWHVTRAARRQILTDGCCCCWRCRWCHVTDFCCQSRSHISTSSGD